MGSFIAGAASARLDRGVGDDYDDPNELLPDIDMPALSGSLRITIPPLHSSFLSSQATQPTLTSVLDVNRIASVVNAMMLKDKVVYGTHEVIILLLLYYSDSDQRRAIQGKME